MEIRLDEQALLAISAAAAREGVSVEDFIVDAALLKAGARQDPNQQQLLELVARARQLAETVPVNATFVLTDLVEGEPWWEELSASSRDELGKLFKHTITDAGFISFNARKSDDKAIFLRTQ